MPYKTNTQTHRSHKTLWIAVLVVVLLAAGGGTYAFLKHRHDHNNVASQNGPTDAQKQQEAQQNQQTKEQTAERDPENKNAGDGSNTGGTPTTPNITAFINRAGQAGSGQPVSVRATVTGTTSGTCTLVFTKTGQTSVSKDFPVDFTGTSSTCGDADVPASSFAAGGDWTLQLSVKSGTTTSPTVSSNVTIEK